MASVQNLQNDSDPFAVSKVVVELIVIILSSSPHQQTS